MSQSFIEIGGRRIGRDFPPFIVAEMSGNHNQSLDRALAIADAAARAGAHALKIQTYTADSMTLDLAEPGFRVEDPNSLWSGKTLHQLYREAYTPREWHGPIFDRCRALGMIAFSTPFDASAVEFLETLNAPCYKIASFENTDIPLLRQVAATGKPVIMSTGMATVAELDESVQVLRTAGCRDLVLLKCTSTYPASPEHSNVRTVPHLRELFKCEVGLSDHTHGVGVAVAAIALGATLVEKHFTLRRADGGVDAAFSLEPEEMALLVSESDRAWQALGNISYGPSEAEQGSMVFRRSLYIVVDMQPGDVFTRDNLRAIRPGYGLPPSYYDMLLGKRVNRLVKRGTPVTWEIIG